jgi:hypothetical protein
VAHCLWLLAEQHYPRTLAHGSGRVGGGGGGLGEELDVDDDEEGDLLGKKNEIAALDSDLKDALVERALELLTRRSSRVKATGVFSIYVFSMMLELLTKEVRALKPLVCLRAWVGWVGGWVGMCLCMFVRVYVCMCVFVYLCLGGWVGGSVGDFVWVGGWVCQSAKP